MPHRLVGSRRAAAALRFTPLLPAGFIGPAAVAAVTLALAVPAAVAQESGTAAVVTRTADPATAALGITGEDVRWRVGVIAHDSMRGRDTPSPGLDATAAWIASELRAMGVEPGAADGSYLQRYPIRVVTADFEASGVRSSTGTRAAMGEGVLPLPFGAPRAAAGEEAPVVLLIGEPGEGGPDGLASGDLAGKHLVFVGPGDVSTRELGRLAASAGARTLLVSDPAADDAWKGEVDRIRGRRSSVVGEPGTGPATLRVRDRALGDLLGLDIPALREAAGRRGSARFRELPGITLGVTVGVRTLEEAWAPNVVGVVPGSDPALRDEYVVFSAHMDHVGVGRPDASGDSIYNGADDDASGTVAVMEIAEAMAALERAPRRSTLFLLVSGEEKGLWGSAWFAENPPVPLGSMVANLNLDMVGRNWSDTIVAIGREHSDLGETLDRVVRERPELGMTAIDDLWPEENFYRRSDHFNFARRGVPVLFFFNGTHDDYHRPSDEPETLDAGKAARVARLVYWLGLEVADATVAPMWNPESRRRIVEDGSGG